MAARPVDRLIVNSKLVPPEIPDGLVVRSRLAERFDTAARVVLVASLPGYGKTVTARQWFDTADVPAAWMSVDLLDGEPVSFWSHLLLAIGSAIPGLDREPTLLLHERGADDALFLVSFAAQLEQASSPAVIVLDGLGEHLDRTAYEGLATLIERSGHGLRFVITTRTNPPLPLARWRSLGWLEEIREDDLRLTDDEAVEVGERFSTGRSTSHVTSYEALNQRVHGWPIGFHMALMTDQPGTDEAPWDTGDGVAPDKLLADYLVAEVLAAMSEAERDVALSLSVLEWFDPGLCDQLIGPDAIGVVRKLLGRGVFLTVVDRRTGAMRFHALFRELLEIEFGLRQPLQRIELHRRAALLWRDRGDLTAAYRHLAAIGEADTAHDLLVGPAFDLVDRGDIAALRRYAVRLPATREVDDPRLALDLAVISFYASTTQASSRWCDRAATLIDEIGDDHGDGSIDGGREDLELRLHDMRCGLALLDADLEAAVTGVEAHGRLGAQLPPTRQFEQRFPILAARVMLASRRREAARWIDLAEQIPGPPIITSVTVPTLHAWHDWLFGRLEDALETADGALRWMDEHDIGAHHLGFDTLITAGWCRLSIGDLGEATKLARRATSDADTLGHAWNHLQAGFLTARLALTTGDPERALRIVDGLRSNVPFESCRAYSDRLLVVEIEALAAVGSLSDPETALAELQPGSATQILRARFVDVDADELDQLLAGRDEWSVPERLQAELLALARAGRRSLPSEADDLLAAAAATGWVLPFVGLGPQIDLLLRSDAAKRIHPKLARTIADVAPAGRSARSESVGPHLTERELTLLELLPTHLSYAEMGERLFLSVNTVKTNLKTLYRKLGASTRTQAVEAGQGYGLI